MEKEKMFLDNFFNPSWELSGDRNDDFFESALSSMVSSPTASNNNNVGDGGNNIALRELIGRLGTICNNNNNNSAGEISPQPNYHHNNVRSSNTSCYSTPLNSPPKLNLSMMMENNHHHHHQIIRNMNLRNQQYSNPLEPFSTADPGFVARAARLSCFADKSINGFMPRLDPSSSRVVPNHHYQSLKIDSGSHLRKRDEKMSASDNKVNSENVNHEFGDSRENSTVSEQIPIGGIGISAHNDSKKRKASTRGKGKDVPSENSEASGKRIKSEDGNEKENNAKNDKSDANDKKSKDGDKNPVEPPKDYIHVRARRGQATDAHSLAERVRREKISERMKFLQDLVPGCNKVTGKAVMLDEIINYVQSLQRQVEFLSMKLATVNPRTDFNMETLASKEMFQSRGSFTDYHPLQAQVNMYSTINSGVTEPFFQTHSFNAGLGRNQMPPMDNFSETASQVSTFWEDDLRSVVQMGIAQNQTQDFDAIIPPAQMKAEQ